MKIQVPEEMLRAAVAQAVESGKVLDRRQWREFFSGPNPVGVKFTREILKAALEWLAQNPVVPTHEQFVQMKEDLLYAPERRAACKEVYESDHVVEWQRRMFLAPEEHKDGTVEWLVGTLIPIGVWAGGKLYTTNIPPEDE